MTLTTHIIIAAAVAKNLAPIHPALAFGAALASHYLADMIPHWSPKLNSVKTDDPHKAKWNFKSREFWKDFFHVAADGFLGTFLLLFALWPLTPDKTLFAFLIILGSVLPDFLQGLYFTRKFEFLKPAQKFHNFFHTKIKLDRYLLIGIPLQLIILAIAFVILL